MNLASRVAIVTGGGQGIGRAIALKLAQAGATVVVNDISETASGVAQEIRSMNQDSLAVVADVSSSSDVARLVETTIATYGKIDILVNNAGINRDQLVIRMSDEDWDRVLDVDLKSVFLCSRAVTPIMKKQGRGKIINISSLGGRTGRSGVGVNYAASKAGVIGLTQTLARELGPAGIYVNAIAPGSILTEQTAQYPREVFETWIAGRAIQKTGMPEDVANVAVFLASSRSDWVTGVTIDVNAGILIR